MVQKVIGFFKTGADLPRHADENHVHRVYNYKRFWVFFGLTFGYAFFYVTRLSFSVVKKPMLEENILNTQQMGMIGSGLLFAYAAGKVVNGFLSDGSNISRFMSFGLLAAAVLNVFFGMANSLPFFLMIWILNGWFLSMGSAPCVVSLNQWFSSKERGTRYGFWYISHSIGEGLSFAGTAWVVSAWGWRSGFYVAGAVSFIVAILLFKILADRPQVYGLPSIMDYKNDHVSTKYVEKEHLSLFRKQLQVFKYKAVWVLGLASATTYIARYAMTNWGVLYLQEVKIYSLKEAGSIMSIASFAGIPGAMLSGLISDRFFNSRRNWPTLIYGIMQSLGLYLLFFVNGGRALDIFAVSMYGFACSGLVIFLGGLIAVDLTPRKVSGAVVGVIGLFSYAGASLQDWVSGALLNANKIESAGKTVYNFDKAVVFWLTATVVSMLLALIVWNARPTED